MYIIFNVMYKIHKNLFWIQSELHSEKINVDLVKLNKNQQQLDSRLYLKSNLEIVTNI